MMSIGIGGVDAEREFWGTPELVENLILYLDLASIKQLAESHKLTRKILGKTFTWNKLIKRIFPEVTNIDLHYSTWPREDDAILPTFLASERTRGRLLAGILSLSEDSDRSQLGMDLFHAICKRYPICMSTHYVQPAGPESQTICCYKDNQRQVDVHCSCLQTH